MSRSGDRETRGGLGVRGFATGDCGWSGFPVDPGGFVRLVLVEGFPPQQGVRQPVELVAVLT